MNEADKFLAVLAILFGYGLGWINAVLWLGL